MALLVDVGMPEWMEDEALRSDILGRVPDADVRLCDDMGNADEIEMAAVIRLRPELPGQLPNLKLIQKLGAGVDTIVSNPNLPEHVRITRLKPDAPAREIAEFCVAYVLREQRNMAFHEEKERQGIREAIPPRYTPETAVGVLGLGHIGGRTARMFAGLGFKVIGWSRSPKHTEDVDCRQGLDALKPMLGECDYICSILPSTPETRGLFNADILAATKQGAVIVNAGRGDLVVQGDLLASLDSGHLGGAVLDVVVPEPLPSDHPYWQHPKVTVTPHVSGWHLDDALKDVAENYRRLMAREPLLHEVDRVRGY